MFSWSSPSCVGSTPHAPSIIPRNVHLSSYLDHRLLKPSTRKVSADDTIFDTVFQTKNGFALVLRIYVPTDGTKAPQMSLHGVIATHNWLDIRMRVIGYDPISSDQSWRLSQLKLGDAAYAVIQHFQLQPPSISQITDENLARLQETISGSNSKKSTQNAAAASTTITTTSSGINGHIGNCRVHDHARAHAQRQDQKEAACKVDEEELDSLIPRVPSCFPEIDELSLSELNDLVNNEAVLEKFLDKISEVNTLRELKESIEKSNVDTAISNLALEENVESICSEVETLKLDLKLNIEKYRDLDARIMAMTRPPEIHEARRELNAAKKEAYEESERFADDWVESGGSDVNDFVKRFKEVRMLYHTRAAKVERLGMSM